MPLSIQLIRPFEHEHESQMFDSLTQSLSALPDNGEPSFLLGNLLVGGRELDAIFIRSGAIVVIEMKGHAGPVVFDENAPWHVGDALVATNNCNPLQQSKRYRTEVIRKLSDAWSRLGTDNNLPKWEHVSAVVCFRGPVSFEAELPYSLRAWFHVTDLDQFADTVGKINKPTLDLSSDEVRWVRNTLGGALHEQTAARRLQLLEYNGSEFAAARQRLVGKTGEAQIALNILTSWRQAARSGQNPLAGASWQHHDAISNLRVYALGSSYFLAAIASDDWTLHLGTIGTIHDIHGWADANRGLTISFNPVTNRFAPTFVNGARDLASPHNAVPDGGLFSHLPGIDLQAWGIPALGREALMHLTAASPDGKIADCLEVVSEIKVREGLAEIIQLLKGGLISEAKVRLDLLTGNAVEVEIAEELVAEAVTDPVNSETVIDLVDIPDEVFDRLFDPTKIQEWMLYLHPGQVRVVDEDFDRPAILRGVSGSGKTCVLIHRAVRLAKADKKVLVLTLNRSLARLIEHNLTNLREKSRVRVMAFYDYLAELLQYIGIQRVFEALRERLDLDPAITQFAEGNIGHFAELFRAREEHEIRALWEKFHVENNIQKFPDLHRLEVYLDNQSPGLDTHKYLYEELMLVRSAHRLSDGYSTYHGFERENRAIQLQSNRREVVLNILRAWEYFLIERGCLDDMALTQVGLLAVETLGGIPDQLRYDHVLVDEFQDFSTLDLLLLKAIPDGNRNGLFLTGDAAQKVFSKELHFPSVELGPEHRENRAIRKNYRNTREVLEAASCLPASYPPPDGGAEGGELLNPEFSPRHGPKPQIQKSADQVSLAWDLVTERIRMGYPGCAICIATGDVRRLPVADILAKKPEKISACTLDKDFTIDPEKVVVSDLSSIKGFEFATVIVVGLDKEGFPSIGTPVQELWREALRLYVAMTRARLELFLLYSTSPSLFLDSLGDTAVTFEHPAILATDETTEEEPVPDIDTNFDASLALNAMELNGFKVIRIPPRITEPQLAGLIGKSTIQISLDCQEQGAFLTPASNVEPHIVRRILNKYGAIPSFVAANAPRLPRGERTPELEYYLPILKTLDELGGSERMGLVLDTLLPKIRDILKPADYEELNSGNRPVRWRNTAQFARNYLKDRGLIKSNSPRGIWELTQDGATCARTNQLPRDIEMQLFMTKLI